MKEEIEDAVVEAMGPLSGIIALIKIDLMNNNTDCEDMLKSKMDLILKATVAALPKEFADYARTCVDAEYEKIALMKEEMRQKATK